MPSLKAGFVTLGVASFFCLFPLPRKGPVTSFLWRVWVGCAALSAKLMRHWSDVFLLCLHYDYKLETYSSVLTCLLMKKLIHFPKLNATYWRPTCDGTFLIQFGFFFFLWITANYYTFHTMLGHLMYDSAKTYTHVEHWKVIGCSNAIQASHHFDHRHVTRGP